MQNNQIRTEDEAIHLIDESAMAFTKAIKIERMNALSEALLTERIGGGDRTMDLDSPAYAGFGGDEGVSPQQFTFRQLIDAKQSGHYKSTGELADHFRVGRKMMQRLLRWIRTQKPEWLDGGAGGGQTFTGSGRSGPGDVKVFDGEIYSNHTMIPPRRWRKFNLFHKTSVRQRVALPFFRRWDKIFLFGYRFESYPNIFYELWFDTGTSTYEIHDKYGEVVNKGYVRMNDVINAFVDLIGSFKSDDQKNLGRGYEEEIEKDLKLDAKMNLNVAGRHVDGQGTAFAESLNPTAEEVFAGILMAEGEDETFTEEMREKLLELTINTRDMLAQFVNSDLIHEYHETRMDRHLVKQKFWHIFTRRPTMPNKFIKGIGNKAAKILGGGNEATFLVGLTLADKVDVEIWYVKQHKSGFEDGSNRATFWVFDLTSGRVVERDMDRMRDAYHLAAKKLAAKT